MVEAPDPQHKTSTESPAISSMLSLTHGEWLNIKIPQISPKESGPKWKIPHRSMFDFWKINRCVYPSEWRGSKGRHILTESDRRSEPHPRELTQIKISIRSAVTGGKNVNIDCRDKSALLWVYSEIWQSQTEKYLALMYHCLALLGMQDKNICHFRWLGPNVWWNISQIQ